MSSTWNATDLLDLGDVGRTQPFLNKYWPQIVGTVFGIASGVAINFGTRRPIHSGIHKHAVGVVAWVGILSYVQGKRNAYLAEKDAVLRHYISLHPEDFPAPERKKWGEIIEPWLPVR